MDTVSESLINAFEQQKKLIEQFGNLKLPEMPHINIPEFNIPNVGDYISPILEVIL